MRIICLLFLLSFSVATYSAQESKAYSKELVIDTLGSAGTCIINLTPEDVVDSSFLLTCGDNSTLIMDKSENSHNSTLGALETNASIISKVLGDLAEVGFMVKSFQYNIIIIQ